MDVIEYTSERDVEIKFLDPLFRDELGYSKNDLSWDVPVSLTFGRERKTKQADLVVTHKKRPVIAVEAKRPTEPVQVGMGQIDSYAFALETPYSLITNGRHLVVRGYYAANRRINIIDGTIDELRRESWAPLRQLLGFDSIRKSMQERPNVIVAPDDNLIKDYRRFFRKIHNAIRDNDKLDPAAAFDELSKLLFLKAAEDEGLRRGGPDVLPALTPERIEEWERLGRGKARKYVYDLLVKDKEQADVPEVLRGDPDFNYPIFMASAEFIGYEPSGRVILEDGEKTDLDLILADFQNQSIIKLKSIDVFDFASRYYRESAFRRKDQIVRGTTKGLKTSFVLNFSRTVDRLDPAYYLFQHHARTLLGALSPLGDSLVERRAKFQPKSEDELDMEYAVLSVSSDGKVTLSNHVLGESIEQKYKKVKAGDIVYNPMRINIGSIGVVPEELSGGLVSPDYVVFESKGLEPNFLVTLLRSPFYRMYIDVVSTGSIRDRLYFDNLQEICVPGLTTQTQESIYRLFEDIDESLTATLVEFSLKKTEATFQIDGLVRHPELSAKDLSSATGDENPTDASVAQLRLAEIAAHPGKVLRGAALAKRMKQWES